jgi:hypothetical protein
MQVDQIKKDWVHHEFDTATFEVKEQEVLDFAIAVGETEPRFTDPSHPDFQAPPTFTAKFVSRRILPESFPSLGSRGFDAGKTVNAYGPVRPGDTLTAHSKIADIYEKTGRSGSMVFLVHRMEFENQNGELVSVVDWRMVRQPDPEQAE